MQNSLSLIESQELPFLLSAPLVESAERTEKWPVLCFLHGLGEGSPTNIFSGITAHGPLRQGSSSLAAGKFIVVAPQLPAQGDIWYIYSDAVVRIISLVHSRHGGDPERTYLSGFSFGGNGVFDLALQHRRLWRALWSVDPIRVPEADPDLPVWLSSGEACRPRSQGFIQRLGLRLPEESDERVYTDEGLDHVGTATSAYRSNRVYEWLLSKRAA
jgi:predicted peptidase